MSWWDSVKQALTPAKRAPNAMGQHVIPTQSVALQFQRIGGGVTPARISTIIQTANSGRPATLVDLVHEYRQKDGHAHAVLETREKGLSCIEWDIVPPEEPSEPEVEAAARLKRALQNIDTFPSTLEHLNGEALLFHYAWSEVFWDVADDGVLAPVRTKDISCRRFGYRQSDGALLFDPSGHQNVDLDGIDLLDEFPAGKFITVRRRITGDVPVREGLGRILVWIAAFRNWNLTDWLQYAEMAWKPARIAKFKRDASKEDKDNMLNILEQLTSSGVALHSDDFDLVLQWAKDAPRGGGNHQSLANFLGAEFSKAVLGQTLTTESGDRGARSLGEVHDEIRKDRRESDAIVQSFAMRKHLVRPFYAYNYSAQVRPAEFIFLTEDRADVDKFSQAIERLRNAGLKIPVSYVYDQTGIPAPDENDEVLPELAAPQPPTPPGKPPGKNDDKDDKGLTPNGDGTFDVRIED